MENLGTSLILGFFDGVHTGHRAVIDSALSFAKKNSTKTVLVTLKDSPSKYFNKNYSYIYSREESYKIIRNLGVDEIVDEDFSKLVEVSAEDFLHTLVNRYDPKSISVGFNYTFGKGKQGNVELLKAARDSFGYKCIVSDSCKIGNEIVSSTLIKKYLMNGEIETANRYLMRDFKLFSTVVEGEKLGRTLGFPTANLEYPENIVKIPYGVYCVNVLGLPAVLNWGVKPTFNNNKPLLEVHIPNFKGNLYGENLEITILKKIRNERVFDSLDELKAQIDKDVAICLEL